MRKRRPCVDQFDGCAVGRRLRIGLVWDAIPD